MPPEQGKTVETGKIFGKMVAAHIREPEAKPLVHIESPESADGKLLPLNKKTGESLEKLSEVLGLPAEISLPLQNSICMKKYPETGQIRIVRKLAGVFPGEKNPGKWNCYWKSPILQNLRSKPLLNTGVSIQK